MQIIRRRRRWLDSPVTELSKAPQIADDGDYPLSTSADSTSRIQSCPSAQASASIRDETDPFGSIARLSRLSSGNVSIIETSVGKRATRLHSRLAPKRNAH
ncbi:hypothetical protein CONPUDRAFT_80057 [Coniophora puteana RWD-64-598 SS2]|uniref:Uncharacterized protein n=1 Tax=Coniophora puteana (strain RWD-64-598) TaxID=741705 RepID=A0A5M3N258_CONPW|nr:uncharacterized protein CONPUDRAFT_80057 [Coniophora puteana RWD-64-598 SS2]EIW85472.1 hypothetical protein CONPUDRAFT_80057 [Coniophora puteana RWD-64-598 SS2]